MRILENVDQTALVDALATYTERYSRLLSEGGKEADIINCRETVHALIHEIELRKRSEVNHDPTNKQAR